MGKFSSAVFASALAVSVALTGDAGAFTRSADVAAPSDNPIVNVAVQKQPAAKYRRKVVTLETDEKPGTIIVDTNNKFLYLVEGNDKATRYGIGVGRDGFGWSGVMKVQRMAEWPTWIPPKEMIARER